MYMAKMGFTVRRHVLQVQVARTHTHTLINPNPADQCITVTLVMTDLLSSPFLFVSTGETCQNWTAGRHQGHGRHRGKLVLDWERFVCDLTESWFD